MPRTEKQRQYAKDYYEKNKEKLLEKSRMYYDINKDVIALKRQKAYGAKILKNIPLTIEDMNELISRR